MDIRVPLELIIYFYDDDADEGVIVMMTTNNRLIWPLTDVFLPKLPSGAISSVCLLCYEK